MEDLAEKQAIEVVKKVSPAVVSIVVSKLMSQVRETAISPFGVPFGPFAMPLPPQQPESPIEQPQNNGQKVKIGGGSGFIVHPDGLILTNKHVVYDADAEYTAVTNEGREYSARVAARDPINDVAVLKINDKNLPTVRLGNSDKIELGQTVLAIGNALGLFSNTVSKGIVSGLGRKIPAALPQGGGFENLRNVIQTDVAINQGNSGGPLINLDGEVIGINTAIIFGAQNIGFALPINWAKADLEDIIRNGRIIRPYIGVRYLMLNKDIKEKYSLPVDYGALVVRDHVPGSQAVVANSPAHKAGVTENDIVLAVNGEKLNQKRDLSDVIHDKKVGDELELMIMRNRQTLNFKIKLEESK